MYPRAGAYIISVKQSTYCQFGEVIRAHSERAGRGGMAEGAVEKTRVCVEREMRPRGMKETKSAY